MPKVCEYLRHTLIQHSWQADMRMHSKYMRTPQITLQAHNWNAGISAQTRTLSLP